MPVLNKEESDLALQVWQLVATDLEGNGAKFFRALLTSKPDVKEKYFPHWSMDDESKFNVHGKRFMEQVETLVKCAGDEGRQGELIENIHTITRMHEPKGIRTASYKIANEVLLNFLAEALGDNLSPEAAAAYKKLLDTMITVIDKELEVIDNE